jgi:caffeoyl-CoA O-methyltransferase
MTCADFNIFEWSALEEEVRLTDEQQRAQGLPPEQRYKSLHPDAAHFLYQLALAAGAQVVVEVGMSAGYSTLWLARACVATGGRVITFERDPAIVNVARDHFARAGVAALVDIRVGDARALLDRLREPVDLAFVDADKDEYPAYAEKLWPLVRIGGSLLADNVISHREATTPYLEDLLARPDATTAVLTIGRGLGWTVKTPADPRRGPHEG